MNYKSAFRLAAAGFVFCACQSDSYHIEGYASQLKDGDTITLALDDRHPPILGECLIANGKFSLKGVTDTTVLCRAYLNKEPLTSVSFFLEPGHITLELNPYPKPSRVSGTELNNEWQALNDEVELLGDQLILLAEKSTQAQAADRPRLQRQVDSLHRQISACIVRTGSRNKDNVLGRYIQQNYKEPEFK